MGGGPIPTPQTMPSKETCPGSSNPKTKPIANTNQITYLRPFFIFSLYIALPMLVTVLLTIGILASDGSIDPKFELHSISIPYYLYDLIGWETTYLNINLTSINPDKDREIICDNLVFSVFHEKELFFVGMVPPIKLGPGEEMLIEERIGVASGSVGFPGGLGGRNYSVKIDGRMRYAPGKFGKRNSSVKARFDNVRIDCFQPEDVTVESLPSDWEVETTVTEEELQGEENRWAEKVVLGLCLLGYWLTPYLCFRFVTRLVWPLIRSFGRLLF